MCGITLKIYHSDWFNKKANSEAGLPDREDTGKKMEMPGDREKTGWAVQR